MWRRISLGIAAGIAATVVLAVGGQAFAAMAPFETRKITENVYVFRYGGHQAMFVVTPEGVIAACALKCMGGEIQGKLWPRNEEEAQKARAMGHDLGKVLNTDDLVRSDNVFFAATGITDGELLDGVKYYGDGARTHSLVMRSKSGTVREIVARHRWDKLMQISQVKYD